MSSQSPKKRSLDCTCLKISKSKILCRDSSGKYRFWRFRRWVKCQNPTTWRLGDFKCHEIGSKVSDSDVWPTVRYAKIKGFQRTSNKRRLTQLKTRGASFLKAKISKSIHFRLFLENFFWMPSTSLGSFSPIPCQLTFSRSLWMPSTSPCFVPLTSQNFFKARNRSRFSLYFISTELEKTDAFRFCFCFCRRLPPLLRDDDHVRALVLHHADKVELLREYNSAIEKQGLNVADNYIHTKCLKNINDFAVWGSLRGGRCATSWRNTSKTFKKFQKCDCSELVSVILFVTQSAKAFSKLKNDFDWKSVI